MKSKLKKTLISSVPYVFIALFATKLGQTWRFADGVSFGERLLNLGIGLAEAMQSPLPSFHPLDLLVGVITALLIRLIVYEKSKNAKKYRRNVEYGSARWGKAEDIAPYIDPDFRNNVILTQTERLTMNNRPKDPKTARNKNVLVVGGSGSGKTRFFVKPQIMQMHSSYVVTDPKGGLLCETGKMLQKNGYKIKVLNTINFKKIHALQSFFVHPQRKRRAETRDLPDAEHKRRGKRLGPVLGKSRAAAVHGTHRIHLAGSSRGRKELQYAHRDDKRDGGEGRRRGL